MEGNSDREYINGILMKFDNFMIYKYSKLVGTKAEVKMRFDMDIMGEESWKLFYYIDIELGDEEELEEGDEVSLDENAMKMEIISRVVGLMDKGELNILLNRLRRKGIG